jgi:hypothetical protein
LLSTLSNSFEQQLLRSVYCINTQLHEPSTGHAQQIRATVAV